MTERSPRWRAVRKAYLSKYPTCAACGGTVKLELHHVVPFHIRPELELVESNLIGLCESRSKGITCHLAVGHLGSYKKANPNVREDAAFWLSRLKEGAA